MSIAARILPIVAALASAGWTAPPALPGGLNAEPVAMHGLQGPPDVRQFYICRVLPKDGGGLDRRPMRRSASAGIQSSRLVKPRPVTNSRRLSCTW